MVTSLPADSEPPDAFEERRLEVRLDEAHRELTILLEAREILDRRDDFDRPGFTRARGKLATVAMETKAEVLELQARLTEIREARL